MMISSVRQVIGDWLDNVNAMISIIRFSKRFLSVATGQDAAEFLEQDFPLSDKIYLRISTEIINDRTMILSAVQVRLGARNHKPRTTSSPALLSEQ